MEGRSYAKQEANFRGDFPKRELAVPIRSTPGFGVVGWSAGAQPRPATFLAVTSIARPLLVERLYGRCFVVLHIEDGVKLRDLQQVMYFLGEVEQLEFATLVFGGGEGADQLADA